VDKLAVWFSDRYETVLVVANIAFLGETIDLHKGRNEVSFTIDQLHLNPGTYTVGVWMSRGSHSTAIDRIAPAFPVDVVDALTEDRMTIYSRGVGLVTCQFQFHHC
jgi:hypothetical protein